MRTIYKIISPLNTKWGAPMGRKNIGVRPTNTKIFDCFVPMNGAYDKGGAYWGLSKKDSQGPLPLRVAYTKDLTYVQFYRANKRKNHI